MPLCCAVADINLRGRDDLCKYIFVMCFMREDATTAWGDLLRSNTAKANAEELAVEDTGHALAADTPITGAVGLQSGTAPQEFCLPESKAPDGGLVQASGRGTTGCFSGPSQGL